MKNIEINEAANLIKDGKLILVPNDKGDILICSAQAQEAIQQIRTHTNISEDQGLNLWVDNDGRINRHIKEVPEVAWDLFDSTEGEIIVVLPNASNIEKAALFADNSAAISITTLDWAKKIIQFVKSPLAAIRITDSEKFQSNLKGEVYVLNLPIEKKSAIPGNLSIIKVDLDSGIKIIRQAGQSTLPHL